MSPLSSMAMRCKRSCYNKQHSQTVPSGSQHSMMAKGDRMTPAPSATSLHFFLREMLLAIIGVTDICLKLCSNLHLCSNFREFKLLEMQMTWIHTMRGEITTTIIHETCTGQLSVKQHCCLCPSPCSFECDLVCLCKSVLAYKLHNLVQLVLLLEHLAEDLQSREDADLSYWG